MFTAQVLDDRPAVEDGAGTASAGPGWDLGVEVK